MSKSHFRAQGQHMHNGTMSSLWVFNGYEIKNDDSILKARTHLSTNKH